MSRDREYLPADVDQRGKRSDKHKALVGRWQTSEGRELANEITVRLLRGKSLERLKALGRIEGRVDLRGFGFPAVERLKQLRLRHPERFATNSYIVLNGIRWQGLDFSHGRLGAIQFLNSRIEDCIFDDAFCEDWKVRWTRVSNSSFVRTNLRGSVVGTFQEGKGNVWKGVDFDRTDLRDAVLRGSSFTNCQFSSINAGAYDGFVRCRLEGVAFSGELPNLLIDMRHRPTDVEPDPGPMRDCDFAGAKLGSNVRFLGVTFENVRFPDNFDLDTATR